MATDAERLALIRQALDKLLTDGLQEWSVLGRSYTRADLSTLWTMEKELSTRVSAAEQGGARTRLARPV